MPSTNVAIDTSAAALNMPWNANSYVTSNPWDQNVNRGFTANYIHNPAMSYQVLQLMDDLNRLLEVLQKTTIKPDYWHAQNIAFRMKQQLYAQYAHDAEWSQRFTALYENLNLKV